MEEEADYPSKRQRVYFEEAVLRKFDEQNNKLDQLAREQNIKLDQLAREQNEFKKEQYEFKKEQNEFKKEQYVISQELKQVNKNLKHLESVTFEMFETLFNDFNAYQRMSETTASELKDLRTKFYNYCGFK
jgi:septal ring factor EnvC (AmiA/AmiB activator)